MIKRKMTSPKLSYLTNYYLESHKLSFFFNHEYILTMLACSFKRFPLNNIIMAYIAFYQLYEVPSSFDMPKIATLSDI